MNPADSMSGPAHAPARGALDGIRVLELGSGMAGAFASRILADFGADVVKVEPDGAEESSRLFEFLNWNKSSLIADPAERTDRELLDALLRAADIVVNSLGPRELADWSLDLPAVRNANRRLVITSISDFGLTGPYAEREASDLTLQAMGGVIQISGTNDREPLKPGLRQAVYCAGLNGAYASLAGLLGAMRTGGGAEVDLSTRECLASELVLNEAHYAFLGAVQGRRPAVQDPLAGEPLSCADGWVSLQISGLITPQRLCELFDEPRLADPRFATSESRTTHAAEINELLAAHLEQEKSAEFFLRASQQGLLSGFVQGAADLLSCPQLLSRGVFHSFEGLRVSGETVRFPAVLANLSETPVRVRSRAPRPGADSSEIRRSADALPDAGAWQISDEAPFRAPLSEVAEPGPLTGLRVVDLSTVFAAPYLAGLLADLGAEVIKVEAPHRLDQSRSFFGPFYDNQPGPTWWNRSGTFQVVNRGKRSITLNLDTDEGRSVLRQLLRESDVLLDNFTPRVMRKWGLTYDEVRTINPALVMLSNTGYGSTGPWASFRAQGTSLESTMGLTQYTGYEGGKPSKAGQSYPDFLACWAGLSGLLAALVHRHRTGDGQWVDLGMYQLGVSVIPEALLHYQATGADVPRRGNRDLDAVFSGLFPASGDDRWIAVSVQDEERLVALAGLVGYAPTGDQGVDEHCLRAAVMRWTATRPAADVVEALVAIGLAAGPVQDAYDLLADPALRSRRFYEWLDFGEGVGERPLIGRPYRWTSDTTSVRIRRIAPDYGEANAAVFSGLLGMSDEELAALSRTQVITALPTQGSVDQIPIDLAALLSTRSLTRIDEDYRTRLRAMRSAAGLDPAEPSL
jgi:crotonobetainyl-CoA:carnitine CoA-transferase CaiB-like acyl-CoA transferase